MVHFTLPVCIYSHTFLLFYPGVFADVSTGHFLSLDPQFTGLGSKISQMLDKKLLLMWQKDAEINSNVSIQNEKTADLIPANSTFCVT